MLCAISGEAPQTPVASRKSGTVFEKRLIESYIHENGKDPVTGEDLSVDDLIELKNARTVKPRPPALTSIPSLLSTFQNEWDALALESFTLKQHLSQLRQELSTALYNNDAAVRVIARLTKERDEARDALSKVTMQDRKAASATSNGTSADAMQVDQAPLPDDVAARIEATRDRLSKTRRKRPVPEDWATTDAVQQFTPGTSAEVIASQCHALAYDSTHNLALVGAADGKSCVYSIESSEAQQTFDGKGDGINDALLWDQGDSVLPIVATASGKVLVLQGDKALVSFSAHAGPATQLSLHPSGDILASVGADKSIAIIDLSTQREVSRIVMDSGLTCCNYHPDGHLLAVGTTKSQIKILDTKTQSVAAEFNTPAPVRSLNFSENGIWLAAAYSGSSTVGIWDLRKTAEIKSLDFGLPITRLRWDYTGQFLAGAGPEGVAVQYFDKASKAWSEALKAGLAASAVEWGPQAKSLVVLTEQGTLSFLQ